MVGMADVSESIRMPFGMHRGEPLSAISGDYLEWALEEAECVDAALRAAIKAELFARQHPPGTTTLPGFDA